MNSIKITLAEDSTYKLTKINKRIKRDSPKQTIAAIFDCTATRLSPSCRFSIKLRVKKKHKIISEIEIKPTQLKVILPHPSKKNLTTSLQIFKIP
ncbi:hypothetical protein ACQCVN_00115 [Rossellomorea aquimaris]